MIKNSLTLLLVTGFLLVKGQEPLSLETCRQMALHHSEDIKIAGYRIEKARAEHAAVKTQYLPSLSATATGIYLQKDIGLEFYMPTVVPDPVTGELLPNVMTHPLTGEVITGADGSPVFNLYAWLPLEISLKGAYLAGIALEQPVYTGGKINAAREMARIGVEMGMESMALQRAQTIYETDQAYWLYVSVQEKVKLAQAYCLLLSNLEQRVRDAFETGYTTRNELLKVTVKHNEARLQLQKAQSGLELTRMALCRITGLPAGTPIVTEGSTLPEHTLNDQPGNGHAGITNRPEYRLLQQNIEMAREQSKFARAGFLPTAGISTGFHYAGGIGFGPVDYDSHNASIIASVKIPLFHWGEGRQKQLSARQDLEIRKAELEKNEHLMALEIEQARLQLTDALARVELVGENLLQAEENLRVNNDNFDVGMGVLTDLLEAQAQWQKARSDAIEANADLKIKETAYLKATGNLR